MIYGCRSCVRKLEQAPHDGVCPHCGYDDYFLGDIEDLLQRRAPAPGPKLPPPRPDFSSGLYDHHKGGRYSALVLALDSTNDREQDPRWMVVYVSLTTGNVHVREASEFFQTMPDGNPRFRKV